jgi:hypothetical protein
VLCCRIMDNLPVAMVKWKTRNNEDIKVYDRGFPVGFKTKVRGFKHFCILLVHVAL